MRSVPPMSSLSQPKQPRTNHLSGKTSAGSQAWKLMLFVGADRTASVRVEVVEHLAVGRSDPDNGYTPGLDLGGYGGQNAGVSRHYAVIDVKDGGLQIRDLDSTNGTRVNGFDLSANHPYRLKQGDEIEFGHLSMTL